jgi:hypothetical protein
VREAWARYRAAVAAGRRRSLFVLFVIALGVLGVLAWGSYHELGRQRRFLHQIESGRVSEDAIFSLGVACQDFQKPFPPGEPQPAPGAVEPGQQSSPEPEPVVPTCQFVGRDGTPIGPTFSAESLHGPNGPQISKDLLDQVRPQLVEAMKASIAETEKLFGFRSIIESRIHTFGTFVGIVFVVLFASTFIGAEFRWGVWRSLLTHEPRRGRVLSSKLLALWTIVFAGFAAALAVTIAVDVVMKSSLHIHSSAGGPSALRIAKESGWAVLSLELYATIGGMLALAVRTSFAGLATLLLIVGDHLITGKYHFLRHYLPVQQVGTLLPDPQFVDTGYVWFPKVTGGYVCKPSSDPNVFSECREILFKPIPHWRASVVLAGWLLAFVLAGWAVLRARDVPQ